MYRREQFVAKHTANQVHFDPNLVTATSSPINRQQTIETNDKTRPASPQTKLPVNQSKLKPTDLSHISYSLSGTPVIGPTGRTDHSTPFTGGSSSNGKPTNRPPPLSDNWPSNIDFRSLLSGAELRNLDLLRLLNDPSVRDWLTETIYPDHVRLLSSVDFALFIEQSSTEVKLN